MIISFDHQIQQAQIDLNRAERNIIKRSAVQALNKSIVGLRADISKTVRKDGSTNNNQTLNLSRSFVKNSMRVFRAGFSSMLAGIDYSKGKAPNLIQHVNRGFNPNNLRKRKKDGTYTKRARKGVPAKPYDKRRYYEGTFIAKGKVYKRSKQEGRKIEQVWGASLRRTIKRDEMKQIIQRSANRRFNAEYQRALSFNIDRYLAKNR